MGKIPFDPYDFFGYIASGLLVVTGMDLLLGFPRIIGAELTVVDSALLLLAIYVTGQIVATPAKTILEDGIVDKILKRPSINLFRKKRAWVRWCLFPGFYKPLPDLIQRRILTRAEGKGVSGTGEALFQHVRYHPQIAANEKLMEKLSAFLNKYGFARNLAFTSLLVGVALLMKSRIVPADPGLARYGWAGVVAGALLFYRYLKFFRQYSYEMFNTYAGLK